MTSKNVHRYYTLICLIRDLLSNVFFSQTAEFPPFLESFARSRVMWNLFNRFCSLFVLDEVELDNSNCYFIFTDYLNDLKFSNICCNITDFSQQRAFSLASSRSHDI